MQFWWNCSSKNINLKGSEILMASYKIISDTACDLYPSFMDNETVPRVPFYVTFDREHYEKEIAEISVDEFYRRIIEDKTYPSTSCPTIPDYTAVFEPCLKDGLDIICFCISSLFSGSYQSAVNAANIILESYPERRIQVIDSVQAAGGIGLLVYQSQKMLEAGYTFDETVSVIERMKHDTHINFTVGTLDFLQHGGRIGKTKALAGTLFNVKPIIVMEEGELFPVENVRGMKKAIKTIIDKTAKEIEGHENEYLVTAFFASEYTSAMDPILEHFNTDKYNYIPDMCRIGVTIGSHTGSVLYAIAYQKKYDLYEK